MNLENFTRRLRNFFLPERTEWGIMLIADFQTSSDEMPQRIKDILAAMTDLKGSKKLHFVFFLNVQLKLLKKIIPLPVDLKNKDEEIFYTVVFDNSNEVLKIQRYDLSKVSGMKKLFNIYKRKKTARHNCLITWGDGFVYSFFSRKEENEITPRNEINDYLKQVLDANAYNFFYNNFNATEGTPNTGTEFIKPFSKYNLSIYELKMAIDRSLHRKFEVTFMQNCGMAYYQTLITSSFYTKSLIASANRVFIDSFNFPELINSLKNSNDEIIPGNLSKMICAMSRNAFNSFTLSNYFKFKELINSLGRNFIALLETENKAELIRAIRGECTDLTATPAFKIIELFELCSKTIERNNDITSDLKNTCEQLIEFKKQNDWGHVSIFFPQSKDDFQGISLLNIDKLDLNVLDQEFLRNHTWDLFIQKYINKVLMLHSTQ